MRTISLPSERPIPVLGQGTWMMAEDPSERSNEIESLRLGIDLGLTLIDTAEVYANGDTERLVAEAIGDRRSEVFLVSKVLPENASRWGTIEACERSLERLNTDYLNLYLLHWRGPHPVFETLEAFHALKERGLILDFGVSNFDVDDMNEIYNLPGGNSLATDQVLYNLVNRGIELDLMPWCHDHGLPIMAYSPIEHSPACRHGMLDHPAIKAVADRHGATSAQVALAWLLHQKRVIVIPKAANPDHVRANRAALDLQLSDIDLLALDGAFPKPEAKVPLAVR